MVRVNDQNKLGLVEIESIFADEQNLMDVTQTLKFDAGFKFGTKLWKKEKKFSEINSITVPFITQVKF